MAVPLADLLGYAYMEGWAASGGPLTDRVRAGRIAAVELGLSRLDDPHVLEATLHLGHLEGVWAAIYDRRDTLHADNRTVLLTLWAPLAATVDVDDLVRTVRRDVGVREAFDRTKAAVRRVTEIVRAILRQVMHRDGWRSLRTAVRAAIVRGLAEGRADALALAADRMGYVGFGFDLAFDDAYRAMQDVPGLLDEADTWLTRALGDQASVIGGRLSTMLATGATRADMVATVTGLLADAQPVALVVDMLTARAMTQGALDLYASENVTQVGVITAGDARVCPQCDEYEQDSPYAPGDVPTIPAHPSCRCAIYAADPLPGSTVAPYVPS